MIVTTIVRILSGNSWKSADYWTEVGWFVVCVSETVTVSDNWFVFNVDSVYFSVCLCISDRICPLLNTCSVRFVIIKSCFVVAIGAGAIELAGARAPKFLTAGARGHNRIYGAPVKNKKINEKAKYSAKEVFNMSSLGNGHTATQLCRSHCVLCQRRQQSDTANSVHRHPASESGKRSPESTPIFCNRLDSGLVHWSRWPKILKQFSKLLK